jgi:molecular chaperone DnaK (HSP70)
MRLGIDFGTTRTVVARADRGNYPVVTFRDADGDGHEHLPSVVALVDGSLTYGFEALAAAADGAPHVRSFKRVLGEPGTTHRTRIAVGDVEITVLELLTGFLGALREAVLASVGPEGDGEDGATGARRPQAVVSVPAHAHTAQRYLTIEAFRRAGFEVLQLVNEPSAAGFEYTHRQPRTLSSRRTDVLVYDLGGGTFDASLVRADGLAHEVLDSVGVDRLGGDDVDVVLAETAVRLAGRADGPNDLTRAQWRRLVDDARDAKERLTPQTRRIVLDVGDEPVIVPADDLYEAAAPIVEASVTAMEPLVARLEGEDGTALASVAGIYLVGGGSGLPLVPRLLRERFGRRVHRSPYPAAATAIGLAVAADPDGGFTLTDRLSRGFGVFRERDAGSDLAFDEILSRSARVPREGAVTVTRRYRPAHNVGHLRYVEYTEVDDDGAPQGALVPFAELVFPYDPALQGWGDGAEGADSGGDGAVGADGLASVAVAPLAAAHDVEEAYTLDADGVIRLTITDLGTGFTRTFSL